jgi:hypothetical protein
MQMVDRREQTSSFVLVKIRRILVDLAKDT